jgi:hypothetical protein
VVSFGGVTTTEVALNSVPLSLVHGRKEMVNVALPPGARVTWRFLNSRVTTRC